MSKLLNSKHMYFYSVFIYRTNKIYLIRKGHDVRCRLTDNKIKQGKFKQKHNSNV